MANFRRRKIPSCSSKKAAVHVTDKKVKRSKPKKKYRSREVSPSWRPKYGCGRLHWIMRDHGSHTRKGKNSRRNRSKAPSCKPAVHLPGPSIPEKVQSQIQQLSDSNIIFVDTGYSHTTGTSAEVCNTFVFDENYLSTPAPMHEEIQVEANNQGEQNSVQMASADGSGKPADINNDSQCSLMEVGEICPESTTPNAALESCNRASANSCSLSKQDATDGRQRDFTSLNIEE